MPTIRLPARPDRLDDVIAGLNRVLDDSSCPMKTRMQLELVTEELFVNVALYSGSELVELAFSPETDPAALTITVSDWGAPFDPLQKPDADVTRSAEEREIGGLGIFLVKKNVDEIRYARQDGKNVLTVRKYL